MKMSDIRNQQAPIIYALAILFILFMTGLSGLFDGSRTGKNRNIGCNPEIYIACSDEGNFNIRVDEYYQRYYNSQDFFHLRANPFGANSPYSATDMQLDTINALNQVWSVIINERIVNKFISDLELTPPTQLNYKNWDELRPIIKNYPNLNPTFRTELEAYGLYVVDSVFNQTLYEAAISSGKINQHINEAIQIYNPRLYENLYKATDQNGKQTRTRWSDWLATIKRYLANTKLNYIVNSTQSLSKLELQDQLLLEKGIFDFDYLTLSMKDIEVEVTEQDIENYYHKVKDNPNYNLKAKPRRIIEFVKWDMNGLDEEQKDSIKILVNEFRKNAKKNWDATLMSNNTYSLHSEITLANEFSLSGSGLSTQTIDADSSRTPFYNIIGAGRKIIQFAFSNNLGTIKKMNINSDRSNTNGFNDIGIFYIKDEINSEYLTIEESGIKDKLKNELVYQKKYEMAKKDFEVILDEYSSEEFENKEQDLLAYLADNDDNLLLMNHNGTINDFINSLINTDLRNTLITIPEFKGFMITLNEGFNSHVKPIDNESVTVFRINKKPNMDLLSLEDYKNTELTRLVNTQSALFVEEQKESANITDNRTLVIY